jgi:hypothetical protein
VRPKKKGITNTKTFKRLVESVFDSCWVHGREQAVSLALFDTFLTMMTDAS